MEELSEGRKLHTLSSEAREKEKNFLESLNYSNQAELEYAKSGDLQGLIELWSDRSITYRHMADEFGGEYFLEKAQADLEAAVRVAAKLDKSASTLPLYNLGKVKEALKKYDEAVGHYQAAIDTISIDPSVTEPSPNNPAQNRPAVLADMKVHMNYAAFKSGDKSARERMVTSLEELKDSKEIDSYRHHVWISGGYMSLAEMLREDDPEAAKKYLQEAKKVIDSDPELEAVRGKQFTKLSEFIG